MAIFGGDTRDASQKKEQDFPFLLGRDVEIVREKNRDTGIKI